MTNRLVLAFAAYAGFLAMVAPDISTAVIQGGLPGLLAGLVDHVYRKV